MSKFKDYLDKDKLDEAEDSSSLIANIIQNVNKVIKILDKKKDKEFSKSWKEIKNSIMKAMK